MIYTRSRGFTLLEMMISLVLMMSLLMVSMRVYEFGVDSWNRADELLTESDTDAVTFSFMRKMLDKLVAENWKPEVKDNEVARGKPTNYKIFDGNHDVVRFAAPLPVHHGKDFGIFLFEFRVQTLSGDQSSSLVVNYYPIQWTGLKETLEQEPATEMLMPYVDSINIEYYGNQDPEDRSAAPKWEKKWENQFYLPMAIRLSIKRSELEEESRASSTDYSQIVMRLGKRYVR